MTDEPKPPRTAAATEARKLPEGVTITKSYRFTLPDKLAEQLAGLSKEDRDQAMTSGLRAVKRKPKKSAPSDL